MNSRTKYGLASIIALLVSIALAISQNKWFSFTKNALSHLGGKNATNPWIFNFGLITAGILGLIYLHNIGKEANNVYQKIGSVSLIFSFIQLVLLGVFTTSSSLHTPIAILFFLSLFFGVLFYFMGENSFSTKNRFLIISVAVLLSTASLILALNLKGLAIPEIVITSNFLLFVLVEK